MGQRFRLWYTRGERRAVVLLLAFVIGLNLSGRVCQRSIKSRAFTQNLSFSNQTVVSTQDRKTSAEKVLLEINNADSVSLLSLYGIGPVFASRIIKYRKLLGGYCRKNQILEVYGMDTLRYNGFEDDIRVDTQKIQKIYLGSVDFRTLLRHPYLDYEQVKTFISYRDKNGPPMDIDVFWEEIDWPDSLRTYLGSYLSCIK